MRTWQETYELAQQLSGDTSASILTMLKSDLNLGAKKLNTSMGRYFTRQSKSTNLVAGQQYYQTPPDCLKVTGIDFLLSTDRRLPTRQIRSEYKWRQLNFYPRTSNYVEHYFNKGSDEFGLYPIPANSVTAGLIIYYEARERDLVVADYSTGTIALTNGSTTVTGTGTAFTDNMIGRILKTTDGTDDYSYKIVGRSSGTVLTLEEPYIGLSATGIAYKIGESFVFPEEYHDAPIDFALARFFELRNNPERANYHLSKFKLSVIEARNAYASSSTSSVITDDLPTDTFWRLPPTSTITE